MKALYYEAYGPATVLKFGELPDPQPGPGELLVEVKAVSLNPVDWKIRKGDFKFISGSNFPKIPGMDFSGIVKGLGAGVKGFAIGQGVYGLTASFGRKPGSCAQLAVVPAKQARLLPSFLDHVQAAALPVAALTALTGLRNCGDVKDQRVAINGATGGVGHFAVQMAKARGAHVTAICRAGNHELAKKLGAENTIDYTQQDFTQSGQKYDVILDTNAHQGFSHFKPALTPNGRYAATLPSLGFFLQTIKQTLFGGPRAVMAQVRALPEDYLELEKMLQSKAIKPVIENKFPISQWAKAFELSESGKVRGKIVLEVE